MAGSEAEGELVSDGLAVWASLVDVVLSWLAPTSPIAAPQTQVRRAIARRLPTMAMAVRRSRQSEDHRPLEESRVDIVTQHSVTEPLGCRTG